MKLPRSYDVVDIAPATGQEAPVIPAAKWYADAIFGHYVLSSLVWRHPHDLIRARGSVTASFGKRAFLVRAIPCPASREQRHKIIHNRVALGGEESVSGVTGGSGPSSQPGEPTHAHLHHRQ